MEGARIWKSQVSHRPSNTGAHFGTRVFAVDVILAAYLDVMNDVVDCLVLGHVLGATLRWQRPVNSYPIMNKHEV